MQPNVRIGPALIVIGIIGALVYVAFVLLSFD